MPLWHISLRAGKPEASRQAIFDGLSVSIPKRHEPNVEVRNG